jgi:NADPH:quinone reductase
LRAVIVSKTGGPEVLQVEELPTPEPSPDEVRVDVAACGVNFIDIYQRTGQYPGKTPFVIGLEGAGAVSAVGEEVAGIEIGETVAWAQQPGAGYAEQVVVPAERVVRVPEGVDAETAAAVMLQGMTAHYLCESTYPVQAGQEVLVHAAAGGVGLLLIQMIHAKGGRVIGTTSTAEKAELARAAGAAETILYDDVDIADEVRRLTDGRGVDVVYDGVGRATFDASLDSLRPRGMLVLSGASSGPVPPFDPQVLNQKGSLYLTRPSLGAYLASRAELLERATAVLTAVVAGRLEVRIGGRYPLEEAAQAHIDLESRATTGKLILVPKR